MIHLNLSMFIYAKPFMDIESFECFNNAYFIDWRIVSNGLV